MMRSQEISELLAGAEVYDLSLDLHPGMPVHPSHPPFFISLWRRHSESKEDVSAAVEVMLLCGHHSTHLDATCHFASRQRLHGGKSVARLEEATGYREGDVKHVAPILRRAVLIDVAAAKGVRRLRPRYPITSKDIQRALVAEGVKIEPGNVALVRTGWAPMWYDKQRAGLLFTDSPGMTKEAVDFLVRRKIACFGIDGDADLPKSFAAHKSFLVGKGIFIIERMYLEDLAKQKCYSSLFFCSPLKIAGATGSPVRPVAIST